MNINITHMSNAINTITTVYKTLMVKKNYCKFLNIYNKYIISLNYETILT